MKMNLDMMHIVLILLLVVNLIVVVKIDNKVPSKPCNCNCNGHKN